MDRIKEKIRERVLQQVPTGVDVDEKYLADAIDRVITEIGQEQYMRFGDRKKMRREIFNSMRKLDVLQELIETYGDYDQWTGSHFCGEGRAVIRDRFNI